MRLTSLDKVAVLHPKEVFLCQIFLGISATLRGIDYYLDKMAKYLPIEKVFSINLWAFLFMFVGISICLFCVVAKPGVLCILHAIAFVLYIGLGVSMFIDELYDGFPGYRNSVNFILVVAIFHYMFSKSNARIFKLAEIGRILNK